MGILNVGCLIENHADWERTIKIRHLTVDAGSEATWIPSRFLKQIAVKPEKHQAFQMANGQHVYRDVGYAIIRVGKRETVDEVVFAEKGD